MAGYNEHIGFSGVLGLIWGTAATWMFGFTPVQGSLVFLLTWFSGMLPDIDSQTGRPVREIFGVVSVIGPLILMQHLLAWGGDPERVLLLVILFYIALRNFGAPLLGKLCVHRGMYHSVPALLIAALTTFLFYKHDDVWVRLLMASGVSIGFLSHLILDEIYSVQWTGARIKLAKSAGSALKWFGHSIPANAFCWAAVMFLGYLALSDVGLIVNPSVTSQQHEQNLELDDAQTEPFEEGLLPEDPESKQVDLGAGTDAPFFQ
ncbi:MAG: metal-dependent hydrolase [Planctomycetaceae bacterium]|nr:metal-dependent hydrolase [Planctomycetaceae bacterium]